MSLPALARTPAQALQLCPPSPRSHDPWPLTSHSWQHPQPLKPRGPTINPSSCQKLWSYRTSCSPPFLVQVLFLLSVSHLRAAVGGACVTSTSSETNRRWWWFLWAATCRDESYLYELLPDLQLPSHKTLWELGRISEQASRGSVVWSRVWMDKVRPTHSRILAGLRVLFKRSLLSVNFTKKQPVVAVFFFFPDSVSLSTSRVSHKLLLISAEKTHLWLSWLLLNQNNPVSRAPLKIMDLQQRVSWK